MSWSTSNICGGSTLGVYKLALLHDNVLILLTTELTHGLRWRLLYAAPQAAWYLATVLWRSTPSGQQTVFPVIRLHQSLQLSPELATFTMKRRSLSALPDTCGMICWSSSGREFILSDRCLWLCSAEDGPVAPSLGLNWPIWLSAALRLTCFSLPPFCLQLQMKDSSPVSNRMTQRCNTWAQFSERSWFSVYPQLIYSISYTL